MPIHAANRAKLGLAALAFLFAGGTWYWTNRGERAFEHETTAALADVEYRVCCSACDQRFEIAASEYNAQLGPEGVRCVRCGVRKAWRVGDAGDDPAAFRAEVERLSSIEAIQAAVNAAQEEFDRIHDQLSSPEVAADGVRRAELKKQQVPLRARLQALNLRWDELTLP